jgi:hypothetical protein
MYAGTLLEPSERVNNDRNACKLKELLGSPAAQTPALPSGGNNRNIHKKQC